MTELLYLPDNDYIAEFSATVENTAEEYIVLDKTHFYPEGGGQPADHGKLEWEGGAADVIDVQKNDGDVRHYIENLQGDLPDEGEQVRGEIDESRREKHRRMHTAQHVLSRIVLDDYGAAVAGNQIHEDWSRIDFKPASFTDEDLEEIEQKTNQVLSEDRSVKKTEMPRDELEERVEQDRSNLDLIPAHVDPLRAVEIEGVDLCPCGGTHVNSLAEIGRIKITDRVSKGADVERIEFELEEA